MATGWPPPDVLQAARDIVVTCPDCAGLGIVRWSKARRWVVSVYHHAGCVTRRRASFRRACERDLADTLAVPLHLAQYAAAGDVISIRHGMARTP